MLSPGDSPGGHPPIVLVLSTVGVIGWVAYYFLVVRPSVTGVKRPRQRAEQGPE